jgi:hypothetical protein
MAKEFNFVLEEYTFLFIEVQTVFLEMGENHFNMSLMFLNQIRPNHYIIQVDVAKFPYIIRKSSCHAALINWRRVVESYRHNYLFVQAKRCSNSSIFNMIRVHVCVEETICHI